MERTISVASKSSLDSRRSRQAKNLVDAKKLGRSEELHTVRMKVKYAILTFLMSRGPSNTSQKHL